MRPRSDNRYPSCNAPAAASCNRRSTRFLEAAYGLTLVLQGCSISGKTLGKPAVAPVSTTLQQAPSQRAAVPALIVSSSEVASVEELFLEGQTQLRQGQPARAAAAFDRIAQHDALGAFGMRALFQGALAREQMGDLEGAAARFEQVERRFPDAWRSLEALVRAMRVRLHLEQWEQAGAIGAHFLERHPHGPVLGRILSHAARGLGSLAAGARQEAEHFISKGLDIVEQLELDRAGSIPRDLAPLYFALGEARRARAQEITLDVGLRQFSARLEQRCQVLLSAQSAYSDTMRAYDAHWSTMAGYRVGELYEQLHDELMRVPPPRAATLREQQLFEGAMRLRYSVLLGKANAMLEHTLAMATRTGEDSEWVRRTERSRANLTRAMAEEQAAIDRLPFTRRDLQRALDDLAASSR